MLLNLRDEMSASDDMSAGNRRNNFDFRGTPPTPPCFFVCVANKGLTAFCGVCAANKGLRAQSTV